VTPVVRLAYQYVVPAFFSVGDASGFDKVCSKFALTSKGAVFLRFALARRIIRWCQWFSSLQDASGLQQYKFWQGNDMFTGKAWHMAKSNIEKWKLVLCGKAHEVGALVWCQWSLMITGRQWFRQSSFESLNDWSGAKQIEIRCNVFLSCASIQILAGQWYVQWHKVGVSLCDASGLLSLRDASGFDKVPLNNWSGAMQIEIRCNVFLSFASIQILAGQWYVQWHEVGVSLCDADVSGFDKLSGAKQIEIRCNVFLSFASIQILVQWYVQWHFRHWKAKHLC